jgi:hypothetical protein
MQQLLYIEVIFNPVDNTEYSGAGTITIWLLQSVLSQKINDGSAH